MTVSSSSLDQTFTAQAGSAQAGMTQAGEPVATPALRIELLHDLAAAGERLEAIADRTGGGQSREAAQRVDAIIEQVRTQGDAALLELTERFDGVRPDPLRVPAAELKAAWERCPPDLQAALQLAHESHQRAVLEYQRATGSDGAAGAPR